MQEFIKIIIGVLLLILGYFSGDFLAKITKEELKSGRKWFRIIIFLGLILGFIGLVTKEDVLLFSSLFIVIVTSRSL